MSKPRFINGCAKSISLVKAFEDAGWDAWTCDILPSEGWHKHIQGDVLKHLNDGWDMAIFHPDCTYLANSGVRWYHERPERQPLTRQAAQFFNQCLNAPIPLICVENPIHHKYARAVIPEYSQVIQPHYFGDKESKAICLWLIGLPKLVRTHFIPKSEIQQRVWKEAPGPERKANRSRNFTGISQAMAQQWGNPEPLVN